MGRKQTKKTNQVALLSRRLNEIRRLPVTIHNSASETFVYRFISLFISSSGNRIIWKIGVKMSIVIKSDLF